MKLLEAYLWFARLYFVLAAGAIVAGTWCGDWRFVIAGAFTIVAAIIIGNLVVMIEEKASRIQMLERNLDKCWERIYVDKSRGLSDTDKSG